MSGSVEGLEAIIKRLENLADSGKIETAMGECCALVEGEAKKKAPKDTGALRNSITSRVENTGEAVKGIVFTPLEYAPYIEYGTGLFAEKGGRNTKWTYQDDKGKWHSTRGRHPHPYLRPALTQNRNKIITRLLKGSVGSD